MSLPVGALARRRRFALRGRWIELRRRIGGEIPGRFDRVPARVPGLLALL